LKRRERSDNATLIIGMPLRTNEEDSSERRENCAHYRACLDYAINKCWQNFSCSVCDAFRLSTVEAKQAAEEIRTSFANDRRS
jgi:RNase H-fold protein (predicted Holliday junction resolvase)